MIVKKILNSNSTFCLVHNFSKIWNWLQENPLVSQWWVPIGAPGYICIRIFKVAWILCFFDDGKIATKKNNKLALFTSERRRNWIFGYSKLAASIIHWIFFICDDTNLPREEKMSDSSLVNFFLKKMFSCPAHTYMGKLSQYFI